MAVSIKHAHQTVIADDAAYDTGSDEWNAEHTANIAASGSVTGGDLTMNTARLLGRTTAGSGAIEEITVASTLTLSGGSLTSAVSSTVALQTVSVFSGTVATGTTTIPFDNTIPQSNEGDQYLTLSITPKSATSRLVILVTAEAYNSQSSASNMIFALFQDSNANAIACGITNNFGSVSFVHIMTSGTTSSTTFNLRIGCSAAGTTTFNGKSGNQQMGGSMVSGISIREIV